MPSPNSRVWLITGASRGFGRAFAEAVAAHGDRVTATARKPETLNDLVARYPDSVRALALDITDATAAQAAVVATLKAFGRVDVLVNNAGYCLMGAVEEPDEDQIRAHFETNLFGALRLTRLVLPHMRAQRSGHILQISSIAGLSATAGVGIYNAGKFALEGFSAALAQEIAPFGIRVTLVEPGFFRTDCLDSSSLVTPAHRLDAYAATAHQTIARFQDASGKQAGDPVRAAAVMIKVVESDNPPLHLPLGASAIEEARAQLGMLATDIDRWEGLARATDFPQGA